MTAVPRADHLSVLHHDDSRTDFTDVHYTLTRTGLRILDTTGTETCLSSNDVLTTDAYTAHTPTSGGDQ